ncbi:putative Phenylacetic acid catabolic family protein [Vibrio crassostreae]|uniref:Phenylacetic acid catabolic protein n=1 Tax=Vibrio TaxID=662 RepID=UPI002A6E4384|nr:putative Phenylacetic acid catabolic family protein [Vibrio chagasii]CAK1985283.1 putative Phenylacetic acid catabolic family protein [Vibrio crassostreae]CAH7101864.1 putative Phenylacetic acid catabolic family protein [Vibrio chagasii]CAK2033119.1 putative Phenylacetic acid catabolic family protein [Vibrio crassostreae]CAK2047038.1 putative Phenylacetic acid catabolic family protein [Vibrio crassostreae]
MNNSYKPLSVTLEKFHTMPEAYKNHCVRIMSMTAFSENLGGEGLSLWIKKAPDNRRRKLVARLSFDELDHGARIYKVLNELGISEDQANDIATGKMLGNSIHDSLSPAEMMYGKVGNDWVDLALHCVLMDTAGGYIVNNFTDSSYEPWALASRTIVDDEVHHKNFGFKELERCIEEGVSEESLQIQFTYWFANALNFFGPPAGKTAQTLKKYGIKRKDNDELRAEFRAEIEDYMESIGYLHIVKLNKDSYPYE